MKQTFWDKKIETMAPAEIRKLQWERLQKHLKRAQKMPLYASRMPALRGLSEIGRLPLTSKQDLRPFYPLGFLGVDVKKIIRVNATSGTTGVPTLICSTRNDIKKSTDILARTLFCAGMRARDVFQNMMTYGLSIGGMNFHAGAEKIGAMAVPIGSGNTQRQIQYLKDLKTTICHATPGYLQYLLQQITPRDRAALSLRKAMVGGEPISHIFRKIAREKYGVEIHSIYGLTECGILAVECPCHNGLHVWEDSYLIEIINPDTEEPVPDGEYGELVVTPLSQEGTPLIRYRTRDITRTLPGACPCGRTHRRIEAISHRTDDMLIINGVNVYPSQIEECIYAVLSSATNYVIVIDERLPLKKMTVRVEIPPDKMQDSEGARLLEKNLSAQLKGCINLSPHLELLPVGTLPEIRGKAKRIQFIRE